MMKHLALYSSSTAGLLLTLLALSGAASEPSTAPPADRPAAAEFNRLWQDALQQSAQQKFGDAIRSGEAALVLARRLAPAGSPDCCVMLESLSCWQARQRAFPTALTNAREAAGMREKLLGKDHWTAVDARENVALIERFSQLTDEEWDQFRRADEQHAEAAVLQRTGKHAEALKLMDSALPVYTKILGPDRSARLTCVSNIVICQLELAQFVPAQPHIRELLEAQPRLKGMRHPDTILCLKLLGRFNESICDLPNAEEAYRKAAALSELTELTGLSGPVGPPNHDTLITYVAVAKVCADRKKFAEAEPILISALAEQRHSLGDERPETAQTKKILGAMYCEQGKFAQAEPLLTQSVATFRKTTGDDSLATAGAGNALGKLYFRTGRFQLAHDNYIRALTICKNAVGDSHPATCKVCDGLAEIYELGADMGRARQLRQLCLRHTEATFGEMNLYTADALAKVGNTHVVMNDFAMGESYLLRAREIRRNLLGEQHPLTAELVGRLAYVYLGVGDPQRAEPLFLQALNTLDKAEGRDFVDNVRLRCKLALLYQSQGKFAEAEDHYRRALGTIEQHVREETLVAAEVKAGLAQTIQSRGDSRQAATLADEALKTYDKFLHPNDPHFIDVLGVAAMAHLALDETAIAERLLTRGLSICRMCLERAGAYESERQRLLQMMTMRNMFDLYLSLPITVRTQGTALYAYYVLTWKGATATRGWRDRRTVTEDMATVDAELQQICRRLSLLTLHPPELAERRDWRGEIFKLNMRKDLLEQQRAAYSAQLPDAKQKVDITALGDALSQDMALIDFLQYTHTSFKQVGAVKEMQKEQRYLAFVVRPDRAVTRIDLGPVAPIQDAVAKWCKTRGFRPDKGKTDWGVTVGNLLWPHLKPWVNGCNTLLISPDGILSQMPWNALPGREPGTYLIEDFAIVMAPVPQLLPDMLKVDRRENNGDVRQQDSLLLVGNIDYDAPADAQPRVVVASGSAESARGSEPMHFEPLNGAAAEVQALHSQFQRQFPRGKALLLDHAAATEDAFWREAPRHRWLHIATHGFFAPPSVMTAIAAQRRPDTEAREDQRVSVFHVGYLNGLALAGANAGPRAGIATVSAKKDAVPVNEFAAAKFDNAIPTADGILTAAELATMDLRNVEVVVLSGCETGLGEVQGGEGALGMQRALQIAGVGTTVGSLWTVPDEKTNLLMQRFYTNLWEKKMPKLQALREAQIWMLRTGGKAAEPTRPDETPTRLSPHYWAAFTLSGDWR